MIVVKRTKIGRSASRQVRRKGIHAIRRGSATLDYVLVMGVILPLATFLFYAGPRIMNLVYELLTVVVSWPFM